MQKLFTKSIIATLQKQHAINLKHRQTTGETEDFKPAVKLFDPTGAATWLFSEWDGKDELFGLCDLGQGSPELGYASLSEIQNTKLRFGLRIERDIHFTPEKKLSEYAEEARNSGRINA